MLLLLTSQLRAVCVLPVCILCVLHVVSCMMLLIKILGLGLGFSLLSLFKYSLVCVQQVNNQ